MWVSSLSYKLAYLTNNITNVSSLIALNRIYSLHQHSCWFSWPGNILVCLSCVGLIRAVPGKNSTDFDTLPEAAGSFYKWMPLNLFVWSFSENTVRLFSIILPNFIYFFNFQERICQFFKITIGPSLPQPLPSFFT